MKLKLPDGSFKAYLFDCDGTIADSMPLHYVAWKKALAEWNCEFSEDLFYGLGGLRATEIINTLNQKHDLNMPAKDVSRRKEELYFESLPQLKAVPEVLEHIEASHGRIPFAVRLRESAGLGDRIAGDTEHPRSHSTHWFAPEITRKANLIQSPSWLPRSGSASRLKTVWYLRIRTWAYKPRRLLE